MRPTTFMARATVLVAPLILCLPAHADSVLDEVVVSAQKREQNIQDVPIAITAFTGDQLRALGVTSSFDVAEFTPGVHISGNLAGQNTQFTIRGVTQNDFNDIIEAPNAVYVDEGYVAIAQAQTFGVFDIDRVEILKGPQGTLFGRNATGGLVQYVTRKPSFDKVEGYADVSGGYYDSPAHAWGERVEAAVGGPLTSQLAGRVAVLFNRHDGYLKNLYPYGAPAAGQLGSASPGPGAGANLGNDDTYALRGTLDFRATTDLLLRLSANYAHSELATGPYQSKSTIGVLNQNGELVNVIDTPANESRLSIQGNADGGGNAIDGSSFSPGANIGLRGRPLPGGDFFGYRDPDGRGWLTSSDFAFDKNGSTRTWGLDGRAEWDLGGGTQFVSITDWKKYYKSLFIDVDSAPVNQLANYAGVDAYSITQELRLSGNSGPLRWVSGLYYLNINNRSENGLKAPVNSIIYSAFGAPFDIGVSARLKTHSYSIFGQVEYALTSTLSATLGLRGIREDKDYAMLNNGFFISPGNFSFNQGQPLPNVPVPGAPFRYANTDSQNLWAGKAQLDWRPLDRVLLYSGINRGVKAGSYNAPLLGSYLGSGGNDALPYKAERLVSYESGFKVSLPEAHTRLSGSVFYYDYKDYQAFLFVGVGGIVINANDHTFGGEFTVQTTPIEGLDLQVGISKFDATVANVPLRSGSPLPPRDVKPTYAPDTQASGLVRYEWPGLGGKLNVRGDVSYSASYFYNLRNFDADRFPGYTVVNVGLGWASLDSRWQTSLEVRNLTQAFAGVQGFDLTSLCGCNEISYQPPRFISVGVKYSF